MRNHCKTCDKYSYGLVKASDGNEYCIRHYTAKGFKPAARDLPEPSRWIPIEYETFGPQGLYADLDADHIDNNT